MFFYKTGTMVLILSNLTDFSTFDVQRWLNKFGVEHIRINNTNDLKLELGSKKNSSVTVDGKKIKLSDIHSVWFRRKEHTELLKTGPERLNFINDVNINLFNEENASYHSLCQALDHSKWLNRPEDTGLNKYRTILDADSVGLKTPDTLISNDLPRIKAFIEKHGRVINKNVRDVKRIKDGNKHYSSLVNIVDNAQFMAIDPETKLLPSLFQEYIEKKMEIRTVFVNNKFFSMAMFTQANALTSVDFRRIFSLHNPTRRIPFKLPKDIERRLRKLFKKIGMNCGSVDLILDRNDEFVFLEINPIGQFGMTSMPCNYYLEKEFAKDLISKETSHKAAL